MAAQSLTNKLSRAIVSSDPTTDAQAMSAARLAIIDYLACSLAGAKDPSTQILKTVLGQGGNAPLIGDVAKFDIYTAAVLNGYAGHVLDYDDVHGSVRGHPTIVIIPALLSASVRVAKSAEAFIAAYIVGLETMAQLGIAMGSKHYETGFHATATLGTIGAAAAVAHFLSFDVKTTAVALGLGATQSGGLRLQFGSDAKPLHAGLAARAGLTAALLAESGFTGAPDFIDSPIGFFKSFALGGENTTALGEAWGAPWQIVKPGLTLKAFPCCTASHPVAVGALALRDEQGLHADEIASVEITFPPGGDAALVTTKPTTGIDARFSAEYVFAAALRDGKLSTDLFEERLISDDLALLGTKVTRRHDTSARRLSPDPTTRFVVIDVTRKDGTKLSKRVDGLPGIADPSGKFADATSNDPRFADIPSLVKSMTNSADLERLKVLINQNSK